MFSHRTAVAGLLLLLVAFYAPATAMVTTIALTDGDASGISGGKFGVLSAGSVNEVGEIVFSAQLQQGFGGVDPNNDTGIWLFDGSAMTLLAREGAGNVPGTAGGSFSAFHAWGIDDAGSVGLRATLAEGTGDVTSSNKEGIWRYTGGVGAVVARTGPAVVPGVGDSGFEFLPSTLDMGRDGQIAHNGKLKPGGGVTTDDDAGLWTYDLQGGTLVARETITPAPGVTNGVFHIFLEPSVNDNQQLVFSSSLIIGPGGVEPDNSLGIWRYADTTGTLIARMGTGVVPDIDSTTFDDLGDPVINGSGQVAFLSDLTIGSTVDPNNNAGVWLYTGTTGALLARTGVGGVPELPGAEFTDLYPPLLSDSGLALVKARLATGPGGVAADNDLGLWTFNEVDSNLVARTGSGGVPGVSGGSFSDFETLAINAQGLVAVKASLQLGGAVDPNNDEGLWLLSPSGSGILVAREGDPLAAHTIAGLSFLGNSGGNDGRHPGWNDRGQLAFQANFTNGDSGLFLFSTYAADFDLDGDVDSDDLTHPTLGWEARYGDVLDGNDFLTWQQQLGSGVGAVSSPTTVIPEPGTLILVLTAVASLAEMLRSKRFTAKRI
ncbi:MAG: hypothetical protein IH831_07410 [Planctomycetes bacterium]|nr:hypothetical protein [Planctomycetota bacterium]